MNNTQLKQVLAHLKQGKTISQAEAIDLFNCYRLSAIIQRLRNAGGFVAQRFEMQSAPN